VRVVEVEMEESKMELCLQVLAVIERAHPTFYGAQPCRWGADRVSVMTQCARPGFGLIIREKEIRKGTLKFIIKIYGGDSFLFNLPVLVMYPPPSFAIFWYRLLSLWIPSASSITASNYM
jgi:hypothetical protein